MKYAHYVHEHSHQCSHVLSVIGDAHCRSVLGIYIASTTTVRYELCVRNRQLLKFFLCAIFTILCNNKLYKSEYMEHWRSGSRSVPFLDANVTLVDDIFVWSHQQEYQSQLLVVLQLLLTSFACKCTQKVKFDSNLNYCWCTKRKPQGQENTNKNNRTEQINA